MRHMALNRALLFIIACFLPLLSQAQISISLNVDSNPNPRIADWVNQAEILVMTVTNTDSRLVGQPFKIQITMQYNNKTVIETKPQDMPTLQLGLGSEVFLSNDIIPYRALVFNDGFENRLISTGLLPPGTYRFCASIIDLNNRVISRPEEVCRAMRITSYQAPSLILPANNMSIRSELLSAATFVWSPITPVPLALLGVKYKLIVSEVKPGQTPTQAFFDNYPLIQEEIETLTLFRWPLDLEPPAKTTQYVWSVQALTLNNELYIPENRGFAKLGTFSVIVKDLFGDNDDEDKRDWKDEIFPPPQSNVIDTLRAGLNGEFEVLVTEKTTQVGLITGKGSVFLRWLQARMDVEFKNIKVDANKRLIEGRIVVVANPSAPVYPKQWGTEAINTLVMSNTQATTVVSWIQNNPDINVPYNNLNSFTAPLQVPMGLNFPDGNQLAITEMVFYRDRSEMNIVVATTLPPSISTNRLGFIGREMAFRPTSISFPPKRIELVEDLTIGNPTSNVIYTLKKPTSTNTGTYIEWNNDGFSKYGVSIEAGFTRNWLIPIPDNTPGARVVSRLFWEGTDWKKLMMTGDLPKSRIVGTGGMTIRANGMFLDLTDLSNPTGIVFPENYTGEKGLPFQGFFMKTLTMELPQAWRTQATVPVITVNNAIVDNKGITMKVNAVNVIRYPDAQVADMFGSIDTVRVEMVANALREAAIRGRIGLPMSRKTDTQATLLYRGLLNVPEGAAADSTAFQLTIEPRGPIRAHILKANLDLAKNSSIEAFVSPYRKSFDMNLNGRMIWEGEDMGIVKNMRMAMRFQGMRWNYNSTATTPITFNSGTWAFASEQKTISNFPITVERIDFIPLTPNSGELFRGRLRMNMMVNLADVVGGSTRMGMDMVIRNNHQGHKFYPDYTGTTFDSVRVYANLPTVSIDGSVGLRSNHPVFGDGFIGNVSANFQPLSMGVSARAEFGNTNYQNGSTMYRYWRVEANATIPSPGITFLPGVAIRRFGGGAFYNMNPTVSGTNITFQPRKSSLGFTATATLATTPEDDVFNTDVNLLGSFTTTGGLTQINFNGNFWGGAGLSSASRQNAMINGTMNANYNFPNRHFNFSTRVNVSRYPITTPSPINVALDINGRTNKWYFKMGEPSNMNTLRVFSANSQMYLMTGNDIPFPSGFTGAFREGYKNATGSYPTANVGSGGVGNRTATGSGFAMGIGFGFDTDGSLNLLSGVDLRYTLNAGAELHLAMMKYTGSCSTFNPVGINGWRSTGSLGFYGRASAGVQVTDWWPFNGYYNIADIGAGGYVTGEFPNPYYVRGQISGRVSLFNTINTSFNRSFTAGTSCTVTAASPDAALVQGDAAADQSGDLIKYVKATSMYQPPQTPIAVRFGLKPNEVFSLTEQQANGTTKNRTFKLVYTVRLEMIAQGTTTITEVPLVAGTNNMGEYTFITQAPAALLTQNVNTNQIATQGWNPSGGVTQYPTGSSSSTSQSSTVYSFIPGNIYTFRVTATLKEWVNNTWVDARRSNGTIVTKTTNTGFVAAPLSN
jgi:hypothetical protein